MKDGDNLRALIVRLEAATEGSEELDAEIVACLNNAIVRRDPPTDDFGPKDRWQFWSEDGKHFLGSEGKFPVLHYTTSLDAALPGEHIDEMHFNPLMGRWIATSRRLDGDSWREAVGHGLTEPLARRIATLKARMS